MGKDKLLLDYQGKSILQNTVDLISLLPVFQRLVVTTAARAETLALPSGVSEHINPRAELGISSSIQVGLKAATGTHFLFLNADQPKLTVIDIIPILEAVKENPDKIIYPIINSKPNSPTIFPESFRAELLTLSGDDGGRFVRDRHPEYCLTVSPENPGNFDDIDKEEEYNELI